MNTIQSKLVLLDSGSYLACSFFVKKNSEVICPAQLSSLKSRDLPQGTRRIEKGTQCCPSYLALLDPQCCYQLGGW